jgi:hypothetical protein
MSHTKHTPALDVKISVYWDGGCRNFNMLLTHEAVLARDTRETLLATRLQETVKVPFEYWRRLEVQIAHVWNNDKGQVIYNYSQTQDHSKTQKEVIEMLSLWQQHGFLEPKQVRMTLSLDIDTSGVHLLPPRSKLPSLIESSADLEALSDQILLPSQIVRSRSTQNDESNTNFKTIVYENPSNLDVNESSDADPILDTHVHFDRAKKNWNKLVFTRTSSRGMTPTTG